MFKKLVLASSISAVLLSGCGSSSSNSPAASGDSGGNGGGSATTSTGVFSDSAVAGVSYITSPSGKSGTTNASGEYEYEDGDTVQFSIGSIQFPAVTAKGKVTPLDMGGSSATLDTTAVKNIIRLLQTLDADGDPENGISVSAEVVNALTGAGTLDFESPTFESDAGNTLANSLTATSLAGVALVSEADAVAHFEGSLKAGLKGSWLLVEGEGMSNVLSFYGDNQYMIAHSFADDGDQTAGSVEFGTYTWNPVSGAFTVTADVNSTDNSGGLSDIQGSQVLLTLAEESLTLSLGEEGTVTFAKIVDSGLAHVGSWFLREEAQDSDNILTFIDATHYVVVHTNNTETYDIEAIGASSEWGTYTYNAATGDFSVATPSVETDGSGGLFDEQGEPYIADMSLQNNGDLVIAIDAEDVSTLAPVAGYSVNLDDLTGNATTAPVSRDYRTFPEFGGIYQFELNIEGAETEYVSMTLDANNGGYFVFNQDAPEDTVTGWSVSSSGVLHVSESDADSSAEWIFTPIAGKDGDSVLIEHINEGDNFSFSIITSMQLAP